MRHRKIELQLSTHLLLKIKTRTLSFLWVIIIHLLTVEWIKKFDVYPFSWSSSRRQMRMEICHVRNELCHVRSVLKKYYKQPQKKTNFSSCMAWKKVFYRDLKHYQWFSVEPSSNLGFPIPKVEFRKIFEIQKLTKILLQNCVFL